MVNRFAVSNFRKGVRVFPSASGTRIRIAQQEDSVAIAAVHAASWRGSYRGILSDEYLNEKLESERLSIWKRRLGFPKRISMLLLRCKRVRLSALHALL